MYEGGKHDVEMPGCPSGINFNITHGECSVSISRADGTSVAVSEDEWRHAVLDFADAVMKFYGRSRLKQPPDDDRRGFECMITELKRRRQKQSDLTGTALPDYGPGMNADLLDLIEQKLGKYPDVRYVRRPGYLEVPARTPSGFRVYVATDGKEYTVGYEGWHEQLRQGA